MVECDSCGHERPATYEEGEWQPLLEACPKCGDTGFKLVD